MTRLKFHTQALLLFATIAFTSSQNDWKPIISSGDVLNGQANLQYSIGLDTNGHNPASSSSKSSITFNGQTISTAIHNPGPVLSVSSPGLPAADIGIDHKARYLDYGNYLTGLFGPTSNQQPVSDQCAVEKFAFQDEGTIRYHAAVPKMEQFTLCSWFRFTNHNGDHTIFTYSVDGSPREIQLWVANANGASYLSLAVHGQSLFRLNYPLKLRKWHHACVSWNGKSGEWQLWVKAERVGRGFHNRVVGHLIQPDGLAYSGGQSATGETAPGHHMEITMLQLYKVGLSAGKAHRDHKHHHAHHFDHEGLVTTDSPPTPAPTDPTPNPILANGPVLNNLNYNLGTIKQATFPGALQARPYFPQTNFMNGQYNNRQRIISQQFTVPPPTAQAPDTASPSAAVQFPNNPEVDPQSNFEGLFSSLPSSSYFNLNNPANVQYLDNNNNPSLIQGFDDGHTLFKRSDNSTVLRRLKIKRNTRPATIPGKVLKKRAIYPLNDGSFVDDRNLADLPGYNAYTGLSQFGLSPDFHDPRAPHPDIEDEIREHDRESAEGEVKSVMLYCTACDVEPFTGAVALAWKDSKDHEQHVLKGLSVGTCGDF